MRQSDSTSLLKIEHIFKSFQGTSVLQDLSLSLSSNAILGLLGPNGAGKTTLLKLITGLIQPDKGSILFSAGSEFIPLPADKMGYSPQLPIFWKNLQVEEQLLFCADLYKIDRRQAQKRAKFLLEQLGMLTLRNQYVERLSGGMQKRINLAMSLIHSPTILLLDEPTANLDLDSKEYVRELLIFLQREENVTIVCATHDLDEISTLATEIAIMREGKIIYLKKRIDDSVTNFDFNHIKDLYQRTITKAQSE